MEEFHVKEPLFIFFYNTKEMSEFYKSVKLEKFKKKKIYGCIDWSMCLDWPMCLSPICWKNQESCES